MKSLHLVVNSYSMFKQSNPLYVNVDLELTDLPIRVTSHCLALNLGF